RRDRGSERHVSLRRAGPLGFTSETPERQGTLDSSVSRELRECGNQRNATQGHRLLWSVQARAQGTAGGPSAASPESAHQMGPTTHSLEAPSAAPVALVR